MRMNATRWLRVLAPVAALGVVVWRLGTGPFLDGLAAVDAPVLAAALGIGVVTTVCCAWRWRTVARGLGVDLTMTAAVVAYYRSLFLNVTVPGGVVGDVHRGIAHGRQSRNVGLGLRAVVLERSAGQVVQLVATLVVLLLLPSPFQHAMPMAALCCLAGVGALILVLRAGSGSSSWTRLRSAVRSDIHEGLFVGQAWLVVVVASIAVVAGHVVVFFVAARSTGTVASTSQLLPLALLALAVMALPSLAGWGPREGGTAVLFGAAGLSAERGVATAVVYGVMALAASLPGAFVLVIAWAHQAQAQRSLTQVQATSVIVPEGVGHG